MSKLSHVVFFSFSSNGWNGQAQPQPKQELGTHSGTFHIGRGPAA